MAGLITAAANAAIAAAYAPEHARLVHTRDLLALQRGILRATVQRNADCEYGRAHRFATIRSVRDFRDAVPPSTWDDYAGATDRIARGERGVLTTEPVRLLEPSSGSTSASKLVPYTASLKAEYQRGLKPWLHHMYLAYPRLLRGSSYWSITPPGAALAELRARYAASPESVPIGFDEDADYLGPIAKRLVSLVFAVPDEVARSTDTEKFLDDTCVHLLAARNLALVSVWNPTLFLILLDRMRERADALVPRLAGRRDEVAGALRDEDWPALWPGLTVISCWADAAAAAPAAALASRFPGAVLQPKGLLATEGFVSLPLVAAGGAVLSARSHFFEFFEADGESPTVPSDGHTLMAHELEVGRKYGVMLTTGGGLYRYRLGDLVEVTGRFGVLPMLRFLGRLDHVSDLVGEKLSEAFVTEVLRSCGVAEASLVASVDHYDLRTDSSDASVAPRVDRALRANFHYDHARRLGQLGPVRCAPAPPATLGATRGRLGDVKPTSLIGPGVSRP
jgi:GH3 auxin-responsive promoter